MWYAQWSKPRLSDHTLGHLIITHKWVLPLFDQAHSDQVSDDLWWWHLSQQTEIMAVSLLADPENFFTGGTLKMAENWALGFGEQIKCLSVENLKQ